MKRTLVLAICAILSLTVGLSPVYAGANPKGKPFVAINEQIVEVKGAVTSLQEQIDLLVARVDTVEERSAADQVAINTLIENNAVLETLVLQNLTNLADIETEITFLQLANADLNSQISANAGDVVALEAEVLSNKALIANLESAILMVQEGVIQLEESLPSQIENNAALISLLATEIDQINEELTMKQNLINGVCPDGQAVREIQADGSVVCGAAGGGMSGEMETVFVWSNTDAHTGATSIPPGGRMTVRADCPEGYQITAPGISGARGWDLNGIYAYIHPDTGDHFSIAQAYNGLPYSTSFFGVATCMRIVP